MLLLRSVLKHTRPSYYATLCPGDLPFKPLPHNSRNMSDGASQSAGSNSPYLPLAQLNKSFTRILSQGLLAHTVVDLLVLVRLNASAHALLESHQKLGEQDERIQETTKSMREALDKIKKSS